MNEFDVDAAGESIPAIAPRAGWRGGLLQAARWIPALGALVLFGQVAFLGLRPALCEARRLAAADVLLQERWDRDEEIYRAYDQQVRVRRDPVFRERQRRARLLRPDVAAGA